MRELAARKVDFVKIWVDDRNGTLPKLSPLLYRAIIDEAHRNKLRVFAHIAALADAKDLLRAGIDGFLHAVRDREVDEELLQLLKERPGVFFTPTLFAPRLNTYDAVPAWLKEPSIREGVSADVIEQLGNALTSRSPEAVAAGREEWARLARNVARLNAAGVRIALGTDVGGASAGGMFGWTEHVELEHMVAAGLTPAAAIDAATRTAAGILRLDRLGDGGGRQERRLHRARRQSAGEHRQHQTHCGRLSPRRGSAPPVAETINEVANGVRIAMMPGCHLSRRPRPPLSPRDPPTRP